MLLTGQKAQVFDLVGGDDRSAAALTAIPILDMCVHISEWFHEHRPLSHGDLEARYVTLALRMAGARAI